MITIPKQEYDTLRSDLSLSLSLIKELQTEIKLLTNGRKSNTSSTPSSQDYSRSNQNNSREKTGRKPGGELGHKWKSLKMSTAPDEIIRYEPNFCNSCGEELDKSLLQLEKRRQEIVIPPITPKYIEHQSYGCVCGKCNENVISKMPARLTANIQYGKNVQALITYLSVYQYLPANRLRIFMRDVLNLPLSEGTIFNILEAMSNKAQPVYQEIKNRVESSTVVGGDETGAYVNKEKMWFWVFQNKSMTFILASLSRGYQTIVDTFTEGFPLSVYISDSLPAQLKINTLAKQLCVAHLMRELKNFQKSFDSKWAGELKQLFKKAIDYERTMTENDYSESNIKIKEFEQNLSALLAKKIKRRHKKENAFVNRLIKNRNAILTFLYFKEVSPDNNGSERAIRNVKVKMKISNQFKSFEFAQHYAVIRSVIDTTIKNSRNVLDALTNLANQDIRPAE
jgi:transposase/polyhydroxyalkanoate synthesis regulator phasin